MRSKLVYRKSKFPFYRAISVNAKAFRVALGFTLIELLVVIAIIALLVSILLPSLNQAKKLAKMAVCMSNLRSVSLAANLYCSDAEEYPTGSYFNMPMASSMDETKAYGTLLLPYIGGASALFCPMSAWVDKSQLPAGSYDYNLQSSEFPQDINQYTGYFYFGNHSCDSVDIGDLLLATGEKADYELYKEGRMYPKDDSAGRAKLFQDLTGYRARYTYCGHNDNNLGSVHSAYNDGSVEKQEIDDLGLHVRQGHPLWW